MSCRNGQTALYRAFGQAFSLANSSTSVPRVARHASTAGQRQSNMTPNRQRLMRKSATLDPKSFGPIGYAKQVKDEDIPGTIVQVIGEKGSSGRTENKLTVLRSIDRTKYFLVKVSGEDDAIPVCKIVPREKIYEQERASNSKNSKNSKDTKEIEIPWKAADGDIEHKLKVAREFLEDGKKVNVVLIARRPREIIKDSAQAQEIMQHVVEKIQLMEGVSLTVDAMSVLGKTVTMKLEDLNPKQKVKQKKEEKPAKQIEMLWNITDEDIKKKAFRIRELVMADIPVNLTITAKKKMYQISESEGNEVISRVWRILSSQMPGIQEIEPREGGPGKTMTFFLGSKPTR